MRCCSSLVVFFIHGWTSFTKDRSYQAKVEICLNKWCSASDRQRSKHRESLHLRGSLVCLSWMQLVILLEFMKCTSGVLTESKESKTMAQLNQTNQKTWHNPLKQGTTKTHSRASWSLRDSSTLAPDTKQTETKKRTKVSGTNNGKHAVSCINAKRNPKKKEEVKKEEPKETTHICTLWHVVERKGLPNRSQKRNH